MSDFDSDSSESDNDYLSPVYTHYLRVPQEEYQNLEVEYSSSSESDQFNDLRASSSSSDIVSPFDVILHHSSEESNYVSDDSNSSENSLFVPFKDKENINALKHNSWSITKELYNREIGNYKNNAMWSNKFYQSVVAVQKLKLSKQLKGHEGCVNSLHFSKTGRLLVSGSDDCNICIWDWSKGKLVFQFHTPHERNIFQTKFLNTEGNMHTIVSSSRDGLIVLSVVNDFNIIYNKVIASHTSSCNKLGVHRDQPYIVLSCGEDGIVKKIDIRESSFAKNVSVINILHHKYNNGNIMHLYGIDINPMNSMEFIVNGDDEYVRMYDKRNLRSGPVKKFCSILPNSRQIDYDDEEEEDDDDDHNNSTTLSTFQEAAHITSAVYNYCGTEILASYSGDNIYLFDVNGSQDTYLHHYSGHLNRATVKGVNFYGPKSDYVISGSDCGYIFIWDKKSEAIVLRKHADSKGAINVLEAHPYIPTLATSGLDNTIKIWEPLNKWQQPNKNKLKVAVVKNKAGRNRLRRRT